MAHTVMTTATIRNPTVTAMFRFWEAEYLFNSVDKRFLTLPHISFKHYHPYAYRLNSARLSFV